MKKPCIDCGTPTTGTRCPVHETRHRAAVNRTQTLRRKARGGRPQYSGQWARQAAAVRANATTCWLCGDGPRPNDPWQADHLYPAALTGGAPGPALPAHRSCNIARSNRARRGEGGTSPYPGRNIVRNEDS